jgi:hypothetical protein
MDSLKLGAESIVARLSAAGGFVLRGFCVCGVVALSPNDLLQIGAAGKANA